jgi:hypothetical protein
LAEPILPAFRLGPNATVRRIAERLTVEIGPYAEIVVRRAAEDAANLVELCRRVSQEIDDPKKRSRFLLEVEPPEQAVRFGPGLVLHGRRNAAGEIVCDRTLRAQNELTVLAIGKELLARLGSGGKGAASTSLPEVESQTAFPLAWNG